VRVITFQCVKIADCLCLARCSQSQGTQLIWCFQLQNLVQQCRIILGPFTDYDRSSANGQLLHGGSVVPRNNFRSSRCLQSPCRHSW